MVFVLHFEMTKAHVCEPFSFLVLIFFYEFWGTDAWFLIPFDLAHIFGFF